MRRWLWILLTVGAVWIQPGVTGAAGRQAGSRPASATWCTRAGAAWLRADLSIVRYRLVRGFHLSRVHMQTLGGSCMRVSIPASSRAGRILRAVGRRGRVAIAEGGRRPLASGTSVRLVCARRGCAAGLTVGATNLNRYPRPDLRVVVADRFLVRGSAREVRDSAGYPAVTFNLDPNGQRLWCRYTTHHVSRYVAIVVDGLIVSDPVVQSPICASSSQITGLQTVFQMRRIAADINSGPLPVLLQLRRIVAP